MVVLVGHGVYLFVFISYKIALRVESNNQIVPIQNDMNSEYTK